MAYQRFEAVKYANQYWDEPNPNYLTFQVDCTNFVSQCLYAGGLPMLYTRKRELGWWYIGKRQNQEWWSYSWSVAHSLQSFLLHSRRAYAVQNANELEPGDIISYDWSGNGHIQHSAIVTAMDNQNFPLVNAHTYNVLHRNWEYRDSIAWSIHTKYIFIKINHTL